jgi:hypothetical protein
MPAVMVTGFRVVAEAIARRWQTPRGGLIDDPNYGMDLTDYVGDDMDKQALASLARQAGAEAEKDERVLRCATTITMVGNVMMVHGKVDTAKGPFELVVSVSEVTITLLQVTPP